jgi:hypothetical protein
VSTARRAAVLWQAWRYRQPVPGDVCAGDGPRLRWDAAPGIAMPDRTAERATDHVRLA